MRGQEQFMQRCLELAQKGAGYVAPNPMVGAVLVYENRIIGEGWHQEYGKAHAEVNCLASVKDPDRYLIPQSTLYVSLEPCNHTGKTPPCTDLILSCNIKHVVIGCRDSFSKVNGTGIERLRQSGVAVEESLLNDSCRNLNRRFFCYHEKKRPYIILKWAQTADGFMANKDKSRIHISNDEANRMVHRWRSEEQAILVGYQTALLDNPKLTTRLWPGPNPIRLVVDPDRTLPATLHLFDNQAPTIVLDATDVTAILNQIYHHQITSVLVEGGHKLLQAFINAGLWDEARIITNPSLNLNEGYPAPELTQALHTGFCMAGNNKIGFFANNSVNV